MDRMDRMETDKNYRRREKRQETRQGTRDKGQVTIGHGYKDTGN